MSKISLQPNASGAGTFSIVSPDSNTNRTLTLPDESGSVLSDVHAAKTGDVHGIPANERAIHSEELRAAVSEATTTAEAVSMTGKGAIVDVIENANGTAVRWESGFQVCFVEKQFLAASAEAGEQFTEVWTFPAAFKESTVPYTIASAGTGSTRRGWANAGSQRRNDANNTTADLYVRMLASTSIATMFINAASLGFWK